MNWRMAAACERRSNSAGGARPGQYVGYSSGHEAAAEFRGRLVPMSRASLLIRMIDDRRTDMGPPTRRAKSRPKLHILAVLSLATTLAGCASAHVAPRSLRALSPGAQEAIYSAALHQYLLKARGCSWGPILYVAVNGRSASRGLLRSAGASVRLEPLSAWHSDSLMNILDLDVLSVGGAGEIRLQASQGLHKRIGCLQPACVCDYIIGSDALGDWAIKSEVCAIND